MTTATEPPDLILAEVRSLRKGRGIQAGDLDQRLGPHLRELAAGALAGGTTARRHALATELGNCAGQLAEDLRIAILASLGMNAQTRHMPHFKDRVSWLAGQLGYEYRTALRRIDTAERLLAEEIARELLRRRGRAMSVTDGWYLSELRVLLRLDTPSPESHEHRRIVATRAGLKEVVAWLDVPPCPGQGHSGLTGEVLYGGRLVRREQPSHSRFQFVVELPRPLQPGDEHEYGLLLRLPDHRSMRPHYIFSAECRCDLFDLRVRFGEQHRPGWIRQVRAETVRMLDATPPAGDPVTLDDAGELHLSFPSPTRYLCYGAQWQAEQDQAEQDQADL